jgi:hypothetical protein
MTKKRDPNYPVMLNLGLMEIRLVSASGLLFSAFDRCIFHPRPQDGVFRCAFNKGVAYGKNPGVSVGAFLPPLFLFSSTLFSPQK